MIDLKFKYPKDPREDAWYLLEVPDHTVTGVILVTATPAGAAPRVVAGNFRTPGDDVVPTALQVLAYNPSADNTGIAVRLRGGTAGFYAVSALYTVTDGSTLAGSAILEVAGK